MLLRRYHQAEGDPPDAEQAPDENAPQAPAAGRSPSKAKAKSTKE